MINDNNTESTPLFATIIFSALLITFLLLGVVVIINGLEQANNNFGGSVFENTIVTNESGYLRCSSNYTLNEVSGNVTNIVINSIYWEVNDQLVNSSEYGLNDTVLYRKGC